MLSATLLYLILQICGGLWKCFSGLLSTERKLVLVDVSKIHFFKI